MKKRLLLVLPFLAITACGNKKDGPTSDVTVTLSQTSLNLSVSDVSNLVATVTGSEESVNWTTSDNSVASVSAGNVTALGEGTCEIYATVSKVTATCYVTVTAEDTNVYDIESPASYNLAMNQKQDIETAVYCYEGENKTKVDVAVNYASSDERIFKLENNQIVPVSTGVAYLLMTSEKAEKRVSVNIYDKLIQTTDDYFEMLSNRDAGKRYFLNNDIDFYGATYRGASTVLSNADNETFKGVFEGNGHTLKNITIECSSSTYASLFGNLSNATIKDLNVEGLRFNNVNSAKGVATLANYVYGFNTNLTNIYVDVTFDVNLANDASKRYVLFNTYVANQGIAECPYYIYINNIVMNVNFTTKSAATMGFTPCGTGTNKNISNVYICPGYAMKNTNTSISVYKSFDELVFTLNSSKVLGNSWEYSPVELKLPTVKEGVSTLTETILNSINGNVNLSNYTVIEDFPFTVNNFGRAYGDYATAQSKITSQFVTPWHSFGGTNPNPFKSIDLSLYNSIVFFAKCPEKKSITVKNSKGGSVDVTSFNPNCSDSWKKIEFMNSGNGSWTLKFDGTTLDTYKFTNLNEFDFCFNSYKFYISELFGMAK